MSSSKIRGLVLIACFAALPACDEEVQEILPWVRVNVVVQLNLPYFVDLQVPLGVCILQGEGYQERGIYLVRGSGGEYAAYDATCPQHVHDRPVTTQLEGTTVRCEFCNTEYDLLNLGMSFDGNHQLQAYCVHQQGEVLYVQNCR